MNKTEQLAFDVTSLEAQKCIVRCKRRKVVSSSPPQKSAASNHKLPLTREAWLREVRKRISAEKLRILPGDNQDLQVVLLGSETNPTEILIGMDRNRKFSGITMTKSYDQPVENKAIPSERCCTEVYEDDNKWYRYLEKPMSLSEVTKETATLVARQITNLYRKAHSYGW